MTAKIEETGTGLASFSAGALSTRSSVLIRRGLESLQNTGSFIYDAEISRSEISPICDILDTVFENYFKDLGYENYTDVGRMKLAKATRSAIIKFNFDLLGLSDEQIERFVRTTSIRFNKEAKIKNKEFHELLQRTEDFPREERVKLVAQGIIVARTAAAKEPLTKETGNG